MIIKSHIRGGYRAAAAYLQAQGENETVRLVGISDPDAHNLAEAFHNMWAVARHTKAKKPLHHISINPMADERLTDAQVMQIIERCAEKYGYQPACHQRAIVEHIKDGRQHFHVVWNRVSPATGKSVWPGCHWNKSKQVAREMERELGLKRPVARGVNRQPAQQRRGTTLRPQRPMPQTTVRLRPLLLLPPPAPAPEAAVAITVPHRPRHPATASQPRPFSPTNHCMSRSEHIAWAWANNRFDVLALYGIWGGG